MSVPRTSNSLRTWSRPFRQPTLSPPTYCISTHARVSDHRSPHIRNYKAVPSQTTRSFQTSTSRYAARSPAVRRAQDRAQAQRSRPVYSSDAMWTLPAHGDQAARLRYLNANGPLVWMQALSEGFLDKNIAQKTFMEIARKLLDRAYKQPPSGAAIQEISPDVDLVFQIGYIVSAGDPTFKEWVLASSTRAGARIPTLMTASRYLRQTGDVAPVRTPVLENVETLALHDRDPRAMVVHARVLGRRGRYTEATALIEQVMRTIRPSKTPESGDGGFAMANIEAPWAVYAWLKEKTGDLAGREEVVRVAARKYLDPKALVEYAAICMRRGDLKTYEECMSQAATAGNADACRKLANFYYLTSLGRYPRRGTKETVSSAEATTPAEEDKPRGLWSSITALFGPQSHKEYRKLALEWYELAFSHGNLAAALILSVILREDGSASRGLHFLQQIEKSPELGPLAQKIKSGWDGQRYAVDIPAEMLDV
ncbi:uncharacterized protein ACLA_049010 [Aspergillus clavatus NRRL 1]|uniref:Uncharacterized protein n=1 Tax=Aspergillus clavatus (strain ATCC 1007 / CBS 513.65 / DSM 816 / NCTC 3887 / NRRL 1 / QM 1276 / 107) TaxID=344612 RepID=A1CHS4_ASPCL|nr:uncharacterized protein ACLA_049010 [Aspergillus clavatus NRRL 1]EAW10429.1 conserved hypothetical protein [Aspergillus clavatus NRRL 1]